MILELTATDAPVELLAEAASWRLSALRNSVLGVRDVVDALYVVDAAHARPPVQIADRLSRYDTYHSADIDTARKEIIVYSVKRAIWVYSGVWNIDKIKFVDNKSNIASLEFASIDYREEIRIIMDHPEKINAERGLVDQQRQELARTLDRIIAPEFDRLDMKLAELAQTAKTIADSTQNVADANKRIETTQREHSEQLRNSEDYLKRIAKKLDI